MTSGNGVLSDTIYQIYGRQIASNMLDINYQDERVSITGFIGLSIIARGNRAFEHFFVNNRYIKSANLSKACEEGYYGFLMGHQYPFFVLNINFDPELVDVNVHPTKQEVRFEDEAFILQTLTRVINERLRRREDVVEAVIEEKKVEPEKEEPIVEQKVSFEAQPVYNERPVSALPPKPVKSPEPFQKDRLEAIKKQVTEQIRMDTPYEKKFASLNTGGDKYEQISFLKKEALKEHKIIGQVFDTYWLVEYDKNLYIIDQHAAHEKVLFEQTMARLKTNQMTTQMVSPPIVVSLSPQDVLLFESYHEAFEKIGFRVEEFGGNELAITGVPGNMLNLDPKNFFMEILADCGSYKASDSYDMIVERVASMSCKAAVKGNNRLSELEIKTLIEDLLKLDNPYHCPHGRPTMISFSEYELAKKFKRIV